MRYKVVVRKSVEGYSVSCPALPECHSQGATKQEALHRIRDSIRNYFAAADSTRGADLRDVDVSSSGVPKGPAR